MCGRYLITSTPERMRRHFGYDDLPNFPPRYNIAPTQPVPVVVMAEGRRRFALVRWGFVPSWAKDPRQFAQLHNARADSVLEKPSFRNAIRRRRCLFMADGFYEWRTEPAGAGAGRGVRKTPYLVAMTSGEPMAMAGIWETWTGPDGEEIDTAAIVTTEANGTLSSIHHRMPVLIPPEAFAQWLDCGDGTARDSARLMVPAPDEAVTAVPVSDAVNKAENDGPALTAPRPEEHPESEPAAKPVPVRSSRPGADERQGSLF
ncbi:MAG TPA: SOS response-associated peptidase [Xanthobacteraceae bacterium]|nr:SOS response-associated peptidase [Xanthobacteraceae bacterium]